MPDFGAIAAVIAETTGTPFAARSATPVAGGSIHRAWRLDGGSRHYFVKTGPVAAAPVFAAEARGLQALANAAALATPGFVTRGEAGNDAFLVLEHLDLKSLDSATGVRLGAALSQLHRVRGDAFGWSEDNFIGATPQINTPHPSWPHFFGERRLRPPFQLALHNGMDRILAKKGEAVIERIAGLFIDYQPQPSLLHGDLWSGNVAQTGDGRPVVFDPACYFGDRETDIAMAEFFGGFPLSFHAAYRAAWPLDPGYEERKTLYNLYHVLNHFNLFGSAYLGQAQRMIERLLAVLKR